MGTLTLVLGYSGTGKSTSLRNFERGQVGVFSVANKPLPFKNSLDRVNGADYSTIISTLKANNMKCYVVDDANYLMQLQNFALAKQQGYGKFVDMACAFEQLIEAAINTDPDTTVYLMMHPDETDAGRLKPKTVGKMLDQQLNIEGMCIATLVTCKDDAGYHFIVNGDINSPAKTPMGMYDETLIDNDLAAFDARLRDTLGMAPLKRSTKSKEAAHAAAEA